MAETETYEFTEDTPREEVIAKLNGADKITGLGVTINTKEMRDHGELLDGDDYTLERFYAFFEGACRSSNADDMEFKARPVFGDKSWGYCGVKVVRRDDDTYRYSYIGLWRFAWNLIHEYGLDNLKNPKHRESKWRRRWCAIVATAKTAWYMGRYKRYRDHIRDLLQRWIWRQQPAFMAKDILNKPEGRQPNGDAEDMDVS